MKILRLVPYVLFTSLILVISYSKLQIVLGAKFLSFSGLNVLFPVMGYFLSPWLLVTLLCIKKLIGYLWLGNAFLTPFTTYIPTLCALIYWNIRSCVIRFVLPLACMVAFICHPVGSEAWVFTLYWLIPIVLYFIKNKSLFVHALSATFIQHAIGAVIWLYMVPTTTDLWYSLLPIVLVERLLFALGTVALIECVQFFRTYLRCYFQRSIVLLRSK